MTEPSFPASELVDRATILARTFTACSRQFEPLKELALGLTARFSIAILRRACVLQCESARVGPNLIGDIVETATSLLRASRDESLRLPDSTSGNEVDAASEVARIKARLAQLAREKSAATAGRTQNRSGK